MPPSPRPPPPPPAQNSKAPMSLLVPPLEPTGTWGLDSAFSALTALLGLALQPLPEHVAAWKGKVTMAGPGEGRENGQMQTLKAVRAEG